LCPVCVAVLLVGDGLEPAGAVKSSLRTGIATWHVTLASVPPCQCVRRPGPDGVTGTQAQDLSVTVDAETLAPRAVAHLPEIIRVPIAAGTRRETGEAGDQEASSSLAVSGVTYMSPVKACVGALVVGLGE